MLPAPGVGSKGLKVKQKILGGQTVPKSAGCSLELGAGNRTTEN